MNFKKNPVHYAALKRQNYNSFNKIKSTILQIIIPQVCMRGAYCNTNRHIPSYNDDERLDRDSACFDKAKIVIQ